MQMIDLLEKKERAIYQLYLRLQDSDRPLTLKELSQELDLSRSTLARYVQAFCEEAEEEQLGIAFQVDGDFLLMERSPILTKQDILAFLCRESVKYQILLYLFDKEEFSIQGLSQTLLISEATLNRQLSSLNKSLRENQISIRNGRIKGSELQIRYFYYQLFWQTMTKAQMEKRLAYQEQLGNLPIFERFYESSFNPRQEQQLALWLTIQQKRMRLRQLDFKELVQLMKPYEEHKFYKRLRKFALTIHQQYAFSFHEGEIIHPDNQEGANLKIVMGFHTEFILDHQGRFLNEIDPELRLQNGIINGASFNYASKNDHRHRQLDISPVSRHDPQFRKTVLKQGFLAPKLVPRPILKKAPSDWETSYFNKKGFYAQTGLSKYKAVKQAAKAFKELIANA